MRRSGAAGRCGEAGCRGPGGLGARANVDAAFAREAQDDPFARKRAVGEGRRHAARAPAPGFERDFVAEVSVPSHDVARIDGQGVGGGAFDRRDFAFPRHRQLPFPLGAHDDQSARLAEKGLAKALKRAPDLHARRAGDKRAIAHHHALAALQVDHLQSAAKGGRQQTRPRAARGFDFLQEKTLSQQKRPLQPFADPAARCGGEFQRIVHHGHRVAFAIDGFPIHFAAQEWIDVAFDGECRHFAFLPPSPLALSARP